MTEIREKVDVCVVGAGHAGCEAALACARLGLETVIFTVSVEIPRGLNREQTEKMIAFAESCKESNYTKKQSFFKRIFDKDKK